jgi:1,4-alpha-glucan branching enzyme
MKSVKVKTAEKPAAASAAKKKVSFELSAEPGSRVFVAGTFNNWDPTANPLKDNPDSGLFKAAVSLPKGMHEYKFVVNGIWCIDPKCPDRCPDGHGSLNSVLNV